MVTVCKSSAVSRRSSAVFLGVICSPVQSFAVFSSTGLKISNFCGVLKLVILQLDGPGLYSLDRLGILWLVIIQLLDRCHICNFLAQFCRGSVQQSHAIKLHQSAFSILSQSCTEQSRALFANRVARLLKTHATRHVTLATLSREKTRVTKLGEKIACLLYTSPSPRDS